MLQSGSVVHAAPAPPTVLSLASAVPAPAAGVETFRLDVGQCATPCDQRLCSDLMQRVSSAALCQVPLGVPRQERFRAWVEQGAPGRALQSWETLVLTSDGSFCPGTGQAGWAVVCSAVDQTGVLPGQFLGCIYGPWHVGALQLAPCAAEPNAYLAETLGLLWTAIIAFKLHPDGHLVVRADNQAALLGVAGSCDMPVHPVCVGARCFHLALQLLGTAAVSHQHVYGHAGDCANELADGLAGLAAASREALGSFAIDLAPWLADAALAARWLPHVCLTSFRPSSMPSLQHGIFSWDLQAPGARLSAELAIAPFLRPLQPPPSVDAESRLAFAIGPWPLSMCFRSSRRILRSRLLRQRQALVCMVLRGALLFWRPLCMSVRCSSLGFRSPGRQLDLFTELGTFVTVLVATLDDATALSSGWRAGLGGLRIPLQFCLLTTAVWSHVSTLVPGLFWSL